MNGKDQFINEIEKFIKSGQKVMLISGTHQYNKHKVVMAVIDKYFKNSKILFRTNALNNITNKDFLGFAGVIKKPKAGEYIFIGNNYYSVDSLSKTTWDKSSYDYDFSIFYPIDSLLRNNDFQAIQDVIGRTDGKVFLITWTDVRYDLKPVQNKFSDINVVYDAFEENEDYHNRVIARVEIE